MDRFEGDTDSQDNDSQDKLSEGLGSVHSSDVTDYFGSEKSEISYDSLDDVPDKPEPEPPAKAGPSLPRKPSKPVPEVSESSESIRDRLRSRKDVKNSDASKTTGRTVRLSATKRPAVPQSRFVGSQVQPVTAQAQPATVRASKAQPPAGAAQAQSSAGATEAQPAVKAQPRARPVQTQPRARPVQAQPQPRARPVQAQPRARPAQAQPAAQVQPPAGAAQAQPPAGAAQAQPPAGAAQAQPPAGAAQAQPPAAAAQAQPPAGAAQAETRNWRSCKGKSRFSPPDINFTGSGGLKPNVDLGPESSYLDIFLKLFPESLVELISNETNRYWQQQKDKNKIPPNVPWVDTTVSSIYTFLAITLLMPHVLKSDLHDYWSENELLATPVFNRFMSRNTYLNILRALHFADNETAPQNDRFFKLRPILQEFTRINLEIFHPFENVAIDESLVLFKGRLFCRQFNPLKRARFGVKLFLISDCQSGFVMNLLPYLGEQTELGYQNLRPRIGMAGQVVMTLLTPYFNMGLRVYVDNWYSSIPLAEILIDEHDTFLIGTIKPSRKLLPKNKVSKLEPGQMEWFYTSKVLYIRWYDKRIVNAISTLHRAKTVEAITRQRKPVLAPTPIADYNRYMNSIDKADMQMSFYSSARKTIKWYRKLFMHILDITVRNSLIIAKTLRNRNIPLKDFRLQLISELLARYANVDRQRPGRPARTVPVENEPRLTERHFLSKIDSTQSTRRTCAVCSSIIRQRVNKQVRPTYECLPCGVVLCVDPCFRLYHTERDYKRVYETNF